MKKNKIITKKQTTNVNVFFLAFLAAILTVVTMCGFKKFSQGDTMAPRGVFITSKSENVTCSLDYKEHDVHEKCTPTRYCGRCIKDGLISETELGILINLAKNGIKYGGSFGGASVLDLHSGALSKGERFVNIYKVLNQSQLAALFPRSVLTVYKGVKNKVRAAIAAEFGIDAKSLYLTKPTFFSRITSKPARTKHDEYWHSHIDKVQYGSFDYTSLLYLSDHDIDFTGGQFVFDDKHAVIEPRKGRVSFFTSGSENPHHVEKVTSGTRYAMTISFTCDPRHSIADEFWQ